MNTSENYAVEMYGITKTFGDKIIANKSVNFNVRRGEIHALVGENGAGKSTLMKILYGLHQADSGIIRINGKEEKITSAAKAIRLQIGMVHQQFMLVAPLTVLENVILGDETTRALSILDLKQSELKIKQLADLYKIRIDPGEIIENTPVGIQQRVEILKILYRNAEILILDEPTAVLTPQEIDDLFNTLQDLKTKGKTTILITHKLDEVMAISDSVTVMRHGEFKGTFDTKSTSKEELAKHMVGYEIGFEHKIKENGNLENVLEVSDLYVLNDKHLEAVKNISFTIKGREILGIAGVEGNGQNELVEAITGLREIDRGTVKINKKEPKNATMAHIPADRHKNGIVMDFSISDNLILGREREKNFSAKFFLKQDKIKKYSRNLIEKFDIRPKEPERLMKELSGGNQQKIVVSRELSKDTNLIVVSHPTRGLDIKAAGFVHNSLFEEKANGKAILLISSDLSELMKLSDRIGVMYNGELVALLNTEKTNEREIGFYMTGAAKNNLE